METGDEMRLVPLIHVQGDPRVHLRSEEGKPICGFKGRGTPTIRSGYLKEMTCDACRDARGGGPM